MVGRLCGIIPDAEDLLRLEPEELAGIILEMISAPRSPTDSGISLGGFIDQALASQNPSDMRQHPSFRQRNVQVERALIEAWYWLENEGFLAPEPDINGRNGYRFITRKGLVYPSAEKVASYRKPRALPWALVHSSIRDKVWGTFLRGDHCRLRSVQGGGGRRPHRRRFPLDRSRHCAERKAFAPETGPLTDTAAPKAEQQALSDLFAGANGSYKNPQSHRHVGIPSAEEAAEMIILASHLLRIIEARAPTAPVLAEAES